MQGLLPVVFIDFVLCVAAAITVVSLFVQVRGLPAMVAPTSSATRDRGYRRRVLAGASGLVVIAISSIALETGGPGVLPWMFVAAPMGMALAYAEARLGFVAALRRRDRSARASLTAVELIPGRTGKLLRLLHGIGAACFILFVGAIFQAQQLSEIPFAGVSTPAGARVAAIIVCLAGFAVLFPRAKLGRWFNATLPLALLVYAGCLIWIILQHRSELPQLLTTAIAEAGDVRSLFAGMFGGTNEQSMRAMVYGITTVLIASGAGLGCGALFFDGRREGPPPTPDPFKTSAKAMLGPALTGAVLAPLTVLALMCVGATAREGIDAPDFRGENVHGEPMAQMRALEKIQSKGFEPSLQGQSIVLPGDSPLKANQVYPMVFRANPRGQRMGSLTDKGNGILVPPWDFLDDVQEVVYRDKDPKLAQQAAYDLHIPVQRTVLGLASAPYGYVYTPVDPAIDWRKIGRKRSGPYLVTKDYEFDGVVLLSHSISADRGLHLAMYDYEAMKAEQNKPASVLEPPTIPRPQLEDIISRFGMRGPYLAQPRVAPDVEGPDEQENGESVATQDHFDQRAPLALAIERERLPGLQPGDRLALMLEAPARGLELGKVRYSGGLDAPPWTLLESVNTLIYPHKQDPSQDRHFRVRSSHEEGVLRFRPEDPEADLRTLHLDPAFGPPRLRVPDYRFNAEVRSGLRIEPGAAPQRETQTPTATSGPLQYHALVPLDTSPEPRGHLGDIYAPHPAELLRAGMVGPYVAPSGSAFAVSALLAHLGNLQNPLSWALLLSLCIMTFAAMVTWAEYGGSIVALLLGEGAQWGFVLLFFVVAGWACTGSTPSGWANGSEGFRLAFKLSAIVLATQCTGLALSLSDLYRRR